MPFDRHRAMRAAAGLCGVALLCTACEGSNLFEGGVAEEPPRIAGISAPASVIVPAQFNVDVAATARAGVASVTVEFTGAIVRTDVVPFPNNEAQVVSRSPIDLQTTADSLLIIAARVADVTGRVSAVVRDTVRIQ